MIAVHQALGQSNMVPLLQIVPCSVSGVKGRLERDIIQKLDLYSVGLCIKWQVCMQIALGPLI